MLSSTDKPPPIKGSLRAHHKCHTVPAHKKCCLCGEGLLLMQGSHMRLSTSPARPVLGLKYMPLNGSPLLKKRVTWMAYG